MDIQSLRAQHRVIIVLASNLGGVAGDLKTRDDAHDARTLILEIDGLLKTHLGVEDDQMYPMLMDAPCAETRRLGATAFGDMGGIAGLWNAYRDRWSAEAMLSDVRRFREATRGVLQALSVRIQQENDTLYPALEKLAGRTRSTG